MNKKDKQLETIIQITGKIYPKTFNSGDWCILSAYDKKNDEHICIKGNVFELKYGTDYKFIGEYENNQKYGEQYNIIVLTPYSELNNKEDFKNFLSYILSSSVIDNMFDTLENPAEVIKEGNVEELCKVKGIQEFTANRIIEKYKQNEMYVEAYVELGKYGLTANIIKKIILKYKNVNTALSKLKTNPYELVSIPNIGWKKADEIAQKMGFDKMSIERLCAFIKYHLNEQAQLGNSWLTPKQLVDDIFDMYKESKVAVVDKKKDILLLIKQAFKTLKEKSILHWNDNQTFICLSRYYNLEVKIASELKRLLNAENKFEYESLDSVVRDIENEKGYSLTDEQISAIKLACEKNVLVITGAGGTGKTTSVQGVLKALNKYSFAQTALSGKASSNLKDVTGQDGKTIHRLLGYIPNQGFSYTSENPLDYDIVIVDEISMVGGEIFLDLLKAIPNGSKLIMLGDANQLPSIGVMNLLQDMLDNPMIPKQVFTKIHRQAQKSAIITESFKVKDGEQIIKKGYTGLETRGELQDFTLDIYNKGVSTANRIIDHFKEEFERLRDISKIQVVVPMKERGDASAFNISNRIQDIYNPVSVGTKVLKFKRFGKDFELRTNDKIINRKNNYKINKVKGGTTEIFNGYIGTIKDILVDRKTLIVSFPYGDVGDVYISGEQLQAIELAYCITAHSYQGSQCDTVIVGVDYSSYRLLSKEWIYTSITRSQKKCILCAETDALRFAISQSDVVSKQTFLNSVLDKELDLVTYVDEDEYIEDEEEETEEVEENQNNDDLISNNSNSYKYDFSKLININTDDLPF